MFIGNQGMDESWPFYMGYASDGWNVTPSTFSTMVFVCMRYARAPFANDHCSYAYH